MPPTRNEPLHLLSVKTTSIHVLKITVMQSFRLLTDVQSGYAGRFVRYAGAFPLKLTNNATGSDFVVQPGAVGICHTVRGITMFVAFEDNKAGALPRKNSPVCVTWPYQAQVYPYDQSGWEVEG